MSANRILLLIPSLRGGGAERVVTTLVGHLAARGLDVHLAALDPRGPFRRDVPSSIPVHDLGGKRARYAATSLVKLVRRLKPDAVMATLIQLNMLLTLVRPWLPRSTRVVIREAIVLDNLVGTGLRRLVRTRLLTRLYRKADVMICQSQHMRKELHHGLSLPLEKMRTIYNPVDLAAVRSKAERGNPFAGREAQTHVVALGSMTRRQKGFDLLIDQFRTLARRRPEAQLWLLGEGSLKPALESQARDAGLAGRVHFPGFQENPYCWLSQADLFVLPSRFEGTPNVLLEAVACQAPVVALDHPGGTREVMQLLGIQSRMVPSLEPWPNDWFQRPAAQITASAEDHFSAASIAGQYAEVLLGAPQHCSETKVERRAAA